MVRERPFQVPPGSEGLHQVDPRQPVGPDPEDVAPAGRDGRRGPRGSTAVRVPGWAALGFGILLTVLATTGAIATGFLVMANIHSAEMVIETREAAERMRQVNEMCQIELAKSKAELSRVDRLFDISASRAR